MNDNYLIDLAERIVRDDERKKRNKILDLMVTAEGKGNLAEVSRLSKEFNQLMG